MTSFQACVWILDEAKKRGDFAYQFAKWLLNHDFDDDKLAILIRDMRLKTMPRARMLYYSDNEAVNKMLDLFNY